MTAKYFAMAGSIDGDDLAGVYINGQTGSSFNGRLKYIDKGYIAHNDWGLVDPDGLSPYGEEVIGCGNELEEGGNWLYGPRGGAILTARNGLNVGTTGDFPSQDEMLVDNYFSPCKYSGGGVGLGQTDCQMIKVEEWQRYVRLTGNAFSSDTSTKMNARMSMLLNGVFSVSSG